LENLDGGGGAAAAAAADDDDMGTSRPWKFIRM